VFPAERLVVLVALDDFGDIVDVVPGRVGVLFEGVQFLVFWDAGDELLEVDLLVRLPLLVAPALLLPLLLPPPPRLQQLLLLLPLLLHVPLHLRDLGLDEVELLVQLQVVLVLLLLQALLLVQVASARVLGELACPVSAGPVLPLLALVAVGLALLVLAALGPPDGAVGLAVVGAPVSVHIRRVVLPVVLLISIVLQPSLYGFVDPRLGSPRRAVLDNSLLVLGFGVIVWLPASHLNNYYQ
jgi:hypothetical protein